MNRLPFIIHEAITAKRRGSSSVAGASVTADQDFSQELRNKGKEYPRMRRIVLPSPTLPQTSLETIFNKRNSSHAVVQEGISVSELSSVLYGLSNNERGTRMYPSGGAKYPTEAYVLVQRAKDIATGVYHYHSPSHSLEQLWELRRPLKIFGQVNKWAEEARVVIVFTANWWKNNQKYEDFGYLLGILETGHAAQNIILSATSIGLSTCPLAGFNDDAMIEILDLDSRTEQPVYCLAVG